MKITDHALTRIYERVGREACMSYVINAYNQGKEVDEDYLVRKVLNTENWSLSNIYRIYQNHLFVFKKEHKKIKLITII